MSYDTGNPVPSRDPRDLVDNAENMDEAVNGTGDIWTDRLGVSRPTLKRLEDDYPQAGVDADRAEAARDTAVAAGYQAAIARDEAVAAKASVDSSAAQASADADRAETAADAAMSAGVIFTTTAEGIADTAEGDYFWVLSADDARVSELWFHDTGSVAVDTGKRTASSSLVFRPQEVGRANGWIDPFFRHLGIGEKVGGQDRWFDVGGSIDTWEFSENPHFNGRAIRKNTDGSAELSGPIVSLADMAAAEGDTVTIRLLITGQGENVLVRGRWIDDAGGSMGAQDSAGDLTASATPQLATFELVVPAGATRFRLYPYTDTASGTFDVVSLWAGKGDASTVPVWPNFNDLDYLQLASTKALQVQGDFYSQFREITTISYDSKTDEIQAPSYTLVARGTPFSGWGSQYTTPGSISFNVVSVPEITREVPASDSQKWSTIRIEVIAVATPSESPLTGDLLAYGEVAVDPEEDTLSALEVGLLDAATGAPVTLTEADLGTQFFVGYRALNSDGGNAIAGEARGGAAEWNGESLYYTSAANEWRNSSTPAIAVNLHLATNLSYERSVIPSFPTGGQEVELPKLAMPPFIYHAGGRQINTYFANMTYTDAGRYRWDAVCNRGDQLDECHRVDDGEAPVDVTLTIKQQDPVTFDDLAAASGTLRMVDASAGTGVTRKLMVIGDSTTANGKMVTEIVNLFGADVMSATMVGTQGVAPNVHEGHSGWKTTDFTGPGRTFFEFTVSGVTEEPAINATEYDHNGSTYEVQEVNLSGGSGTIICERLSGSNDPLASGTLTKSNASDGDATITFSAWAEVAGNPFWNDGSSQLDFSAYMSANGFSMAADDWVMIHLGINDCFSETTDAGVDALTDSAFPALDALISSIRAYEPGIRIGMCVPVPPPADQDAFVVYSSGQTRHRYMRNIHRWALNLIDYYSGQEGSGNYVIPLNTCWDTVNNAQVVMEDANSRTAIQVGRQKGGVHPHDGGYEQMADCVFSVIKYHE